MTDRSKKALQVIAECIHRKRYRVLAHFTQRMHERGLFWPDVLAVIDAPADVRADGNDRFRRPKWIVRGTASDGLVVSIVCVLDSDDAGKLTVFLTLFWDD